MPASCSGAMRTTFRGNSRPIPRLRIGIVWGGPGRCWRETSRGLSHPMQFRGHPLTGCLRTGWLQAGIPGETPRSPMHHPRSRAGVRNRAGHHASVESHGRRASAAFQLVAPARAPAKYHFAGNPPGRGRRRQRDPLISSIVMLNLFQHPPGGQRQASEWTLKQVQGDEGKTHPHPSCQRRLASISHATSQANRPGDVPQLPLG